MTSNSKPVPAEQKSNLEDNDRHTSSGPLIVHVVHPTIDEPSTEMFPTRNSRRQNYGLSRNICVILVLAILAVSFMFIESTEELEVPGSHSREEKQQSSPHSRQNGETEDDNGRQRRNKKRPVEPSEDDEVSAPQKPFSLFGAGQSRRFGREVRKAKIIKKKETDKLKGKRKKANPFPVIDDDDRVPRAVAGSIVSAADALLCRESVIDYVINATDLRDECEGLKKAYTKNCGGEDDEEESSENRRRRLLQRNQKLGINQNPVVAWKRWLHKKHLQIKNYWPATSTSRNALLIEDKILEHWDDAAYEVSQDWDYLFFDDIEIMAHDIPRNLNEADAFIRAEQRLERRENAVTSPNALAANDKQSSAVKMTANKTSTLHKEKQKLANLAIPTTNHHVSNKMLGETLLLHQEDRHTAHSKATSNNATAHAAKEAAESNKALSDHYQKVENVLNDPHSQEARTCCTSILNVFHENCYVDEEEEFSDSRLFIAVTVIALCGMVKSLIRHFQIRWLPEAAGCILVGVTSGWALSFFPHHDISFDGKWFLRILVPPIVFEAALSIDKRSFNRHIVPIIFYAIIGTLMSTGLTAFFVHKGSQYYHGNCETIPVVEALTFGSLISSIDPIAVLSVLSNMGMTDTDTIYVVIFGESLLNDGVAIVLYQTLVQFLDVNMHVDGDAVVAGTIHFFVVAIGSLLVGVGSGLCCTVYYWAFHGCQTPLVEVLMFCCWALLPYYVCDGIEWSGIVAVVAAGFVMDIQVVGQKSSGEDSMDAYLDKDSSSRGGHRKGKRQRRPIFLSEGHLSREAKTHIGFVTEIISTMMETAIFAYLGLFLFSSRYHWNNYHSFIAIAACCGSRAIMIPLLSALANWLTKAQHVQATCRTNQCIQHGRDPSSGKLNNPAGVIIDKKMQLVLWFAGLRGAMSFALVEDIPTYDAVTGEGTRLKSELKAMTSACIIFTVFVLGGLTYYMMEAFGMTPVHSNESGNSKSFIDREMELIGLLPGPRPIKAEDYNMSETSSGDYTYDNSGRTGSPSFARGYEFRQRSQAT